MVLLKERGDPHYESAISELVFHIFIYMFVLSSLKCTQKWSLFPGDHVTLEDARYMCYEEICT